MKEHKPTIRDVSKILGKQVSGWNDKRSDYSRIKLTCKLDFADQYTLLCGLRDKFANYKFTVGNIRWNSWSFENAQIVGAITFWK